jgi:16S rRNA (adenine1518-N6/adenine1519-N6)-dimethyltransferase
VTLSRSEINDALAAHDLRPSRALGQNFVADANTVRRIARLADVGANDHVVEIGAGLGSLTLALAETGASVTAVEIDRHLMPLLRERVEPAGVRVVEGDATTLDWVGVLAEAPVWSLVANLPYNVATPLVLDLLDEVPQIQQMLVMVQREAGERLAASAGDDAYGIPSVKVAYWATASVVGRVGESVFVPRPRVESVLVRIVRRPTPAVKADPDVMFSLVRTAFGKRRKMLRRSLEGRVTSEQFEQAGVASDDRPEQLDVEAWGRLADAVAASPPRGGGQLIDPH